jgi:hypothetical protein
MVWQKVKPVKPGKTGQPETLLLGRLRDALECVVPLACALPEVPNSVRFACPGPLVDRLYVGELKRDVS